MFVDDVALEAVALAVLDSTGTTYIRSLPCMNPKMHIEIALVFCGIGTVGALEVHLVAAVLRLASGLRLPLMSVLYVIFQVLLSAKRSLTVLTFQVVLLHFLWGGELPVHERKQVGGQVMLHVWLEWKNWKTCWIWPRKPSSI